MFTIKVSLICLLLAVIFKQGSAIWCYRCTSATPGCAEDFNWRGIGYLGEECPDDKDICVKTIEKKGATQTIMRDCLSSLKAIRTDIPADQYEGCRTASEDVRLAHYVNNSIKELDIKRNHFDSTVFCFCFLDHRCNSSTTLKISWTILLSGLLLILSKKFF